MRRFFLVLRILPLIGFCVFAAVAALRVQADQAASVGKPKLPSRIGASQHTPSFAENVALEMSTMWVELYISYLPGLMPEAVAYEHTEHNSLDALKMRTKKPAYDVGGFDVPLY
ncbi:hypothetical protein BCF46_3801 [Litoreibacter meonggei]|uniref:Uncharacterized protein n=1 Tax=Litoreibacter meonggei TaxID=1049199 RepID=A0A497VI11_9RHOB|nr:hypothetical protein [Litoreibacter meonggei]RLJ36333.1 hypothetical protein BCF46_3801 [Litoreibacter meonggei]